MTYDATPDTEPQSTPPIDTALLAQGLASLWARYGETPPGPEALSLLGEMTAREENANVY